MRYHLHRLTQIIPLTLLVDHALIDTSGTDIIRTGSLDIQETLVMAQVQLSLISIDGNVTFPMLIRVQRTRVDVDVRIKFLDSNLVTSCLKELT